ncbi:head-tail connector protein [Pseudomonas asiatica]|uniref:head-tail connector protein n=1 Tax=Pseudomonas asiatica TaxID=2219225 RepID=UPI001E32DA4F|nr:head-tail connector protein [Pseudomonas asiatica]MCE0943053.1 head-tail connector protein [Pseudomonas asiatica]MCE1063854.1 head-tail connector protein [Pseudomonas asiatica]
MTTVTLEEAKMHLRVDHDEEDGHILGLIAAAETHVSNFLGDGLPDPMPAPVKAAVLLLVGDLYENRERQGDRTLTEGTAYSMLLAPYRSMAVL